MGISLMSKRRRFIPFFAMLVVCLLASTVIAPVGVAQTVVNPPQRFAPDRVLVVFHPGASASEVSAAHSQARGNVVNTIDAYGVQVVAIPTGTVLDAIQHYPSSGSLRIDFETYDFDKTSNKINIYCNGEKAFEIEIRKNERLNVIKLYAKKTL